ncbi:hypothetical protein RISK_006708 [Rhodopirellula islandica]|uniref:Lipocalin-like domain-containing protein n=1 Tax=Rhodopirellula islandica TaxID=595434 RepID=A0A0J1E6Q3_RHOIS|nr:hypothetical protein [Rhodopirellula islandica]KLU01139.1 hypothetical protein RISK_006708 [Rhodopirellula islandica]
MSRYTTMITVVAWLLTVPTGCGPTAPSVANGPPVVSWNHLQTENWRYELQDQKRIANYSFGSNGGVLWTEGTKRGGIHEEAALGGQWYIDDAGDLIITDENHSQSYRTLQLVSLTVTDATVLDADTGVTELYSRRYRP